VSVAWHISLPLMNSFSKTEAAVFRMQVILVVFTIFLMTLLSSRGRVGGGVIGVVSFITIGE